MKKFIATLAAAGMLAVPANAGNDNLESVIAGVILGAVIADVKDNSDHYHPKPRHHHYPKHRHFDNRECYVDVYHGERWTTRVVRNCHGEVIRKDRWRN